MAPAQGLQLGLLIGAEHVLVRASGWPSQTAVVEVEHPGGLAGEVGSRGKIQERCRQGRIASAASQRPTVEAEIDSTTPRVTASAASSAQLHRASGTPVSAGSSQASALTSASAVLGRCAAGPAGAGRPARPGPRAQNRARHLRTVSSQTPSRRAIAAFGRAVGGGQHDPGAQHVPVRGPLAIGPAR